MSGCWHSAEIPFSLVPISRSDTPRRSLFCELRFSKNNSLLSHLLERFFIWIHITVFLLSDVLLLLCYLWGCTLNTRQILGINNILISTLILAWIVRILSHFILNLNWFFFVLILLSNCVVIAAYNYPNHPHAFSSYLSLEFRWIMVCVCIWIYTGVEAGQWYKENKDEPRQCFHTNPAAARWTFHTAATFFFLIYVHCCCSELNGHKVTFFCLECRQETVSGWAESKRGTFPVCSETTRDIWEASRPKPANTEESLLNN